MNKQIIVIGLILSLRGAYLFSLSSVTVLSEFDVIPKKSFITYYGDIDKIPLPMANYRLELTNNNKESEIINGELIPGEPIDLYVFDEINYRKFKGCGGVRDGETCKDWEPIISKLELTGTFKRSLDPNVLEPYGGQLVIVVWNLNEEKAVNNSISIRLESDYSGIANIVVIIGLGVFYLGMSSKKGKKSNKKIRNKDIKEQ